MEILGTNIKISGRFIRIARLDEDKYESPDDPAEMLRGLRSCGRRIDLFTFLQKLPETSPKFPYPMVWDNLAVLPVTTFDHWWNEQIRSFPRNRARQAEKKGVVLREVPFDNALVEGVRNIYNECPIRQGKRFPHYGMSFERAHEYAGTYLDRSIFVGAFVGDTMIGFAKLTTDKSLQQACLVHILSMVQHQDKAPNNALIAHAVRACADRKIAYLLYQNFAYGKRKGDSLSRFKETNGFQRIDLPRYYVPVTPIGWAALRLGLHREFIDYVANKLREIRRVWYTRNLESRDKA